MPQKSVQQNHLQGGAAGWEVGGGKKPQGEVAGWVVSGDRKLQPRVKVRGGAEGKKGVQDADRCLPWHYEPANIVKLTRSASTGWQHILQCLYSNATDTAIFVAHLNTADQI